MRHVDDTHHAESDGETNGGEQQNRAQAQPLEDRDPGADELETAIDRADRALDRSLQQRIIRAIALMGEKTADLGIARAAELGNSRQPLLRIAAVDTRLGERQAQRAPRVRIALRGKRLLERVGALGHGMGDCFLRRREPVLGVRAEERELAHGGVDLAAQPIVDANLVDGVAIDLAQWRMIDGIEQLELVARFLGDDHLVVGGGIENAVGQGLERGGGAGVAQRSQRVDRGDLALEVIGAELIDELAQIRGTGDRRQETEPQKGDEKCPQLAHVDQSPEIGRPSAAIGVAAPGRLHPSS